MSSTPDSSSVIDRDTSRPAPLFVGDHLALDFLNSIASPKGTPVDWLRNGQDLIDWLSSAGILTPAEGIRLAAQWDLTELDAVAREAVELREWFRRVVVRAKQSGPAALTSDDLAHINTVLARNVSVRRIEPTEDGAGRFSIVERRLWTHPRELLAPLGTAIADLISNGDFNLIRRCENPPCTVWFYDRTKGHRRRWCSQSTCGNRAKVAAFRLRKRLAR